MRRAACFAFVAVVALAAVPPAGAGCDHGLFEIRVFLPHQEEVSDVELDGEIYLAVWQDLRSSSHWDI